LSVPAAAGSPIRIPARINQVRERAREDGRNQQRAPDRPTARHGEIAERRRDGEKAERAGPHLHERQRDRVVPLRVALEDLQRLRNRRREDERVAGGRTDANAGQDRVDRNRRPRPR
jgi:hypothetical protein